MLPENGWKKVVGGAPVRAADVHVKALRLRVVRGVAQMPFAHVQRHVAGCPQRVGNGRFLQRQIVCRGRRQQLRFGFGRPLVAFHRPFTPDGHVQPGSVLAGHDGRPSRRADRHGVRLSEPHALVRQPVQIRCFVQIRAVAGQVGPTQIVSQNEDDVGPLKEPLLRAARPIGLQSAEDKCEQYRHPNENVPVWTSTIQPCHHRFATRGNEIR